MTSSYEDNVLKISGGFQYHHCRIIRSFVSVPELVPGGVNGHPVMLTIDGTPYITDQGQKYVNPNDSFNPLICLFVWMEDYDQDNVLCHWIVRFRLCDSSGFLRNQDYYKQLDSLARALTGIPDGFQDVSPFHLDYNDPLPKISAISRRLNSCRDSYFSAADAIQQTTPSDPMTEKPKTFHAWAFKRETPSVHFHDWADNEDLEFLNFGETKPIKVLGSSLIDHLPYLHFTACLTDGFSNAISYQLINWSIRRGYDQLASLWDTTSNWGRSPYVSGPDF